MLSLGLFTQAWAAYYDTLPKGVRTLVWRNVRTTDINSRLNDSSSTQAYDWSVNLDSATIQELESVGFLIDELNDISPAAAAAFTAGEYRGTAVANVTVDATGLAWGFTNNLTGYVYAPYFRANVDVNIQKLQDNNVAEINGLIDPNSSTAAAVFDNLSPELARVLNERTYQSVFVNSLGYQPLGDWEGQGFGDTEVGMLYRITDKPDWGIAVSTGFMIPTGYVDRADVVQDFGFGDGQWDAFGEIGGGFDILPEWTFDTWVRYTYQFPMTQVLRVPESEDFPFGSESETFYIKLGDRIKGSISSTYEFNDYLSIRPEYLHEVAASSDFRSLNPEADRIYEVRTNQVIQEAKLSLMFTTVNWFQQGKFIAPLDLSISAQTLVNGRNVPDFSRFDLDFRIYF